MKAYPFISVISIMRKMIDVIQTEMIRRLYLLYLCIYVFIVLA